jgi:predicted RNA binding protein YcfA (HicA-like mRNA interferase family)
MTEGFGKAVRDLLRTAGCVFVRHGKGDHDIWRTTTGRSVTVPVKIMSRHTANGILKKAGIQKAF